MLLWPSFAALRSDQFLLVVATVVCGMSLVGCGDETRDLVFTTDTTPVAENNSNVERDIEALGDKKLTETERAQRIDALIRRGVRIEPQLIEALGRSSHKNVRLGVVEVLKAVATQKSMDALIKALTDEEPLVALNVEYLLREMTKHQVIPLAGQPPRDGLPPVPSADNARDLRAAEAAWATWHRTHRETLQKNWRTWWTANRDSVVIK